MGVFGERGTKRLLDFLGCLGSDLLVWRLDVEELLDGPAV